MFIASSFLILNKKKNRSSETILKDTSATKVTTGRETYMGLRAVVDIDTGLSPQLGPSPMYTDCALL